MQSGEIRAEAPAVSVPDAIRSYLALKGHPTDGGTFRQYSWTARKFAEFTGKAPSTWTQDDARRYLISLDGLSTAARAAASQALIATFRALGLEHDVESWPRYKRSPPSTVHLSEEECARLIAISRLRVRDHAIVVTLARTGLRVSEACALRPSDVLRERGELYVSNGKGGKPRYVQVDEVVLGVLDECIKERGPLGPADTIFGIGPDRVAEIVKDLARTARIDRWERISPHKLRHTYATSLRVRGVDLQLVGRQLGHSSVATTEIYSNIDREEVRKKLLPQARKMYEGE